MSAEAYLTLQILAAAGALAAALFLYFGSLGVPFELQTWKGQTDTELRIKRRQRIMKWAGIASALLSFFCTVLAILYPPN
jgi:hypothetical protein